MITDRIDSYDPDLMQMIEVFYIFRLTPKGTPRHVLDYIEWAWRGVAA